MGMIGKQIQLKGLSHKGKNRIRENGDRWTVLAETERVLFAPGIKGPWLFITPVGSSQDDKAARWIKATNDPDFNIIVLDGLT